jgi:hypothetical protein
MTPRERFIAALERRPIIGRVPHFELVFFLTMEAFGRVHPSHRNYAQWDQMEEKERQLHRSEMADIFIATAERFERRHFSTRPDRLEGPSPIASSATTSDRCADSTGTRPQPPDAARDSSRRRTSRRGGEASGWLTTPGACAALPAARGSGRVRAVRRLLL